MPMSIPVHCPLDHLDVTVLLSGLLGYDVHHLLIKGYRSMCCLPERFRRLRLFYWRLLRLVVLQVGFESWHSGSLVILGSQGKVVRPTAFWRRFWSVPQRSLTTYSLDQRTTRGTSLSKSLSSGLRTSAATVVSRLADLRTPLPGSSLMEF